MLYDYRKEYKTPMSLVLENGFSIEGEFIDLRIATDTLPEGKVWYHIRQPYLRFSSWFRTGNNGLDISELTMQMV